MSHRLLIESSPQIGATTPAQTSVTTSAGLILAANPLRKGFLIQNTGTTVIKISFGPVAANPTQTVYHLALKGCSSADDGTGSVYTDDAWGGDVRAISSAGGGTCVIVEFRLGPVDWNQAYQYSS